MRTARVLGWLAALGLAAVQVVVAVGPGDRPLWLQAGLLVAAALLVLAAILLVRARTAPLGWTVGLVVVVLMAAAGALSRTVGLPTYDRVGDWAWLLLVSFALEASFLCAWLAAALRRPAVLHPRSAPVPEESSVG